MLQIEANIMKFSPVVKKEHSVKSVMTAGRFSALTARSKRGIQLISYTRYTQYLLIIKLKFKR